MKSYIGIPVGTIVIISLFGCIEDSQVIDHPPEVEVSISEKNTNYKKGDTLILDILCTDPDMYPVTQYYYSPYGSGSGGSGGYADGDITSFDLIISDQAGNNSNISGLFGFFRETKQSFKLQIELNTSQFSLNTDTSKLFISIKVTDDEKNVISGTGDLTQLIDYHFINQSYGMYYWLQWDDRGCRILMHL